MPEITELFRDLPMFSKTYVITAIALGIIAFLRFIPYHWVLVEIPYDLWTPKVLLSYMFVGKASIGLLLEMYIFSLLVGRLEMSYAPNRYADWWYMLLILGLICLLGETVMSWHEVALMSKSFVMALTYVFCKRNPHEKMMLMFMITCKASYLPFAQVVIDLLQGGNIISPIIGIVAGWIYIYFKDVLPVSHRKDYLATPRWVIWLYNKVSNSSLPWIGQGAPAQFMGRDADGNRPFAGRGIRIG